MGYFLNNNQQKTKAENQKHKEKLKQLPNEEKSTIPSNASKLPPKGHKAV